jgi:pimeloyl-ACP methyl ester carboxylesterase
MEVDANERRLWFDVQGPALVPEGPAMRERPTVVLLYGGPGSSDHSYLKPDVSRLAEVAQVVYLDLPGHGRSEWGDPAEWSLESSGGPVLEGAGHFTRKDAPERYWLLSADFVAQPR